MFFSLNENVFDNVFDIFCRIKFYSCTRTIYILKIKKILVFCGLIGSLCFQFYYKQKKLIKPATYKNL